MRINKCNFFIALLLMGCSHVESTKDSQPTEKRQILPEVSHSSPANERLNAIHIPAVLNDSVRNWQRMVSATKNGEKAKAIWYGIEEHGQKTASGEVYDLYEMTAAHASLPLFSRVIVRNIRTGRNVVVTINDRLSTQYSSTIKLSYYAARKLNLLKKSGQTVELIPLQ
jgi:rare lipoprotein A (peptidoglycan hydrolase)